MHSDKIKTKLHPINIYSTHCIRFGVVRLKSHFAFWYIFQGWIRYTDIYFEQEERGKSDMGPGLLSKSIQENQLCFTVLLRFHIRVFGYALCVHHLILRIQILGSCVFTLILRCYQAHGELKMASNQHIVNTKISWTHASTNLLDGFVRSLMWA